MLDPATAVQIRRHQPAEPLRAFIRHYWFITWDLGERVHVARTLPIPACNAVLEADRSIVSGVATRRFDKPLTGHDSVFAALFHPTGLAGFTDRPLHTITDRYMPWIDVFGASPDPIRDLAFRAAPDEAIVGALDDYFLRQPPQADPEALEVARWVAAAEIQRHDRAEALAADVGVSLRTLQRGMRRYVGVTPKWLLRRFRMLEAAAILGQGGQIDMVSLALRLGFADQAHFSREFSQTVGRSPSRYLADQRRA